MDKRETKKQDRILIIGETEGETRNLANALASGFHISAAPGVADAAGRIEKEAFKAIIYDLRDGGADLENIIGTLQQLAPMTPVIVFGPLDDVQLVVRAIKAGATDYITRPLVAEKIRLAVNQAIENRSLKNEIDYLRRQQDVVYDYDRIIAVSPAMKEVMDNIRRLAQTESTILMTGETGTGKSFLSGNIHFNSSRRNKPFIKVNCANIPETLMESELFGHEKGAFTGADKTRIGRFEQADGGTLFLDEFCELSIDLQAKLLRVLEEKSFERLGGGKTIHSDTRIIAATNRDIEDEAEREQFRADLYYRLAVLTLRTPALKARGDDVALLAEYFLQEARTRFSAVPIGLARGAVAALRRHDWPGNVRELRSRVYQAAINCERRYIEPADLGLAEQGIADEAPRPLAEVRDKAERAALQTALRSNAGNVTQAAKTLRISRMTMYRMMEKHGLGGES